MIAYCRVGKGGVRAGFKTTAKIAVECIYIFSLRFINMLNRFLRMWLQIFNKIFYDLNFFYITYGYETEPHAGTNAMKIANYFFTKTVKGNVVFPLFCTFLGGLFQNSRSA